MFCRHQVLVTDNNDLKVAGCSIPGIPLILTGGYNEYVGWGIAHSYRKLHSDFHHNLSREIAHIERFRHDYFDGLQADQIMHAPVPSTGLSDDLVIRDGDITRWIDAVSVRDEEIVIFKDAGFTERVVDTVRGPVISNMLSIEVQDAITGSGQERNKVAVTVPALQRTVHIAPILRMNTASSVDIFLSALGEIELAGARTGLELEKIVQVIVADRLNYSVYSSVSVRVDAKRGSEGRGGASAVREIAENEWASPQWHLLSTQEKVIGTEVGEDEGQRCVNESNPNLAADFSNASTLDSCRPLEEAIETEQPLMSVCGVPGCHSRIALLINTSSHFPSFSLIDKVFLDDFSPSSVILARAIASAGRGLLPLPQESLLQRLVAWILARDLTDTEILVFARNLVQGFDGHYSLHVTTPTLIESFRKQVFKLLVSHIVQSADEETEVSGAGARVEGPLFRTMHESTMQRVKQNVLMDLLSGTAVAPTRLVRPSPLFRLDSPWLTNVLEVYLENTVQKTKKEKFGLKSKELLHTVEALIPFSKLEEIIREAVLHAVKECVRSYGPITHAHTMWHWGVIHSYRGAHPTEQVRILGELFSPGPITVAGGSDSLCSFGFGVDSLWHSRRPMTSTHIPTSMYRLTINMSESIFPKCGKFSVVV